MEFKKKKTAILSALFAGLAFAVTCWGDSPEPVKHYKLEFIVQEVDGGKVINSRSYSVLAASGDTSTSIRAMNQVPIGSDHLSIGADLDCKHLSENAEALSLFVNAEVNGIQAGTAPSERPIIRRNQWNSGVVVPFRKPTVIFSSDDATSTRQIRVELTATPVR